MTTGLGIARLRKRVAFELFLRRLVAVTPDRWVLKSALALDFRFRATSRPTRDMDLGRADDEDGAIEDFVRAAPAVLPVLEVDENRPGGPTDPVACGPIHHSVALLHC
jgi:hypothetical protein